MIAGLEDILEACQNVCTGGADMKAIRALLAVGGVTRARAQALQAKEFSGTINLPGEVEWQGRTLPAGSYALFYGTRMGGADYVEIEGQAEGSPHLFIVPQRHVLTSATQSELVCVRNGDSLIVLGLRMPNIGESVSFAVPQGEEFMAERRNSSARTLLAERPMPIQSVPVS